MKLNLTNKIALVTGASRGLGRAIAKAFSSEGATVVICARSERELLKTMSEFDNPQNPHSYIAIDLDLRDSVDQLAETIIQRYGRLDILVHNLGGSLQITDFFAPYTDWEKVFRFNLGISIDLNNYFIPIMKSQGSGRIIHISSIVASTLKGNPAYSVAKSALNSYIKILGREVAKHNIILSGLMPGPILIAGRYFSKLLEENKEAYLDFMNKQVGIQRISTPEEIANYVIFLASEYANYNPGAIWNVDGATL